MLASLHKTAQGYEVEVIAVVDNDIVSANIAMEYKCQIVEHSDIKRGALYCWNRALKLATETSPHDLIIPAGDDQIFHEDWLKFAVESHNKLGGYGVVGMNDLAYDGNLQVATMFVFDRLYCQVEMGGVFAPPMYNYYCIDSEWNEKAKMLGKFYWEARSRVEHIHSAHGKRLIDELDREKMDSGWMEADNKTFADRKARGFPIEWTPII